MKPRSLLLTSAVIGLWAISVSLAFCATWYVSTNGNNAATGTLEEPWATFRYGLITMADGDTLILRGGEHHDDGNQLTEFKNNTTIRNHSGEFPVYRSTNYAGNMVRINGKTNIVISGIDFFGDIEPYSLVKIDGGAQNVTLTNCTIRGCRDGHGLLISPLDNGSENGNLVITHCNFITNGWAALPTDPQLHQIYMQNSSNIVEYCYIQGVTNVGGGTLGIHNFVSDGHDYIFRNNFITNCAIGIGLVSRQSNVFVYNNILTGNKSWGVSVFLSTAASILNNTLVDNGAGIIIKQSTNIFVENNITTGGSINNPGGIYLYTDADGVYVRNNLAYSNSFSDYRNVGAVNVTTNGNLFRIEYSGESLITNSMSYDARFRNALAVDFRILSDSSAKGTGRSQSIFTFDYGDFPRGSAWDIGAWGYRSAGNATANMATIGRIIVQ